MRQAVLAKESTGALEGKTEAASSRSRRDSVPLIVHEVLHSPGQPLDQVTRVFMERRFAYDFSKVRIHIDAQAAESARAVDALAYTVGRHIVLASAVNAPHSREAWPLIAHELTHVAQQGDAASRSPGDIVLGPSNGESEREAAQAARQVVAGQAPDKPKRASPGSLLQRQGSPTARPLVLSLPRQRLKSLGNPDINEIIDALPGRLFNGQSVVIKRVTIDGIQHVFQLSITIKPGAPPGQEAGITLDLTPPSRRGAPGGAVTHPISLTLFQRIPDPEMTLFHELIHVRLIMDRYLPQAQQSATYAKFAQRLEMASDPALLAVTKTTPKRQAVFDGMQSLRNWYKTFVTGFKEPPALGPQNDAERYRTLINEYFTNKEAQRAFKKSEPNSSLGRRYAGALRIEFQVAAQDQNLFASLTAARQRAQSSTSLPSDFDVSDQLGVALAALFDALDQQLQDIERFKQSPPPSGPTQPSIGYPRPLGIGGQELREGTAP